MMTSPMSDYHKPVMLEEAIDGLVIEKSGKYFDVTYGGGGHSQKILSRLNEGGSVYGLDRDLEALYNEVDDQRLTLIRGNFRYLSKYARLYGLDQVDGVLADLGVSSHQFDEKG